MTRTRFRKGPITLALALVAATMGARPSFAADVYLVASQFTKTITLPGGGTTTVTMWGFAEVAAADFATSTGTPTVPGPRIVVPPGDTTLTIHLRNILPVAISIVIPGQTGTIQAVPSSGRVRSWAPETAPGGQSTYTFSNVKPGTYLYHSGTHAAVQVQMGLYGGMTKDVAANTAYAGIGYGADLLVIFSEIDPALHAAVAAGEYAGIPTTPGGSIPAGPMTSTIDYRPRVFLVNGEPHHPAAAPLGSVPVDNQPVLVRFVNAGLRSHVPALLPDTTTPGAAAGAAPVMNLVAEDGNPGPGWDPAGTPPYPRYQSRVFLPAGKTLDALWVPAAVGRYPLYDRFLNLTTDGQLAGGMLAYIEGVPPGNTSPVAHAQSVIVPFNSPTPITLTGFDADGDPLTYAIVTPPVNGTLSGTAPALTYTPTLNYVGPDSFTFTVNDGTATSAPALVSITVMASPPGAFGKLSPANGAKAPKYPTFTWGASAAAERYEFCADQSNDNTCNTSWQNLRTVLSTTGSNWAVGNWSWHVRAANANGATESDGGAWWTVKVRRPLTDVDLDAKADLMVWRQPTGTWYVAGSGGSSHSVQWGSSALNDVPVPGDYDGDGKTDLAVWRPQNGHWYVLLSTGGVTETQWGSGALNDVPVPGDYDGDSKTDLAVWRPENGHWYVLLSTGGAVETQWGSGAMNDVPVPADFDGDGRTDLGIWRPSVSTWWIRYSSGGTAGFLYGTTGDEPVPGDYDGDTIADLAVFRPGNGRWYVHPSATPGTIYELQWGVATDIPMPGDYDGDGKTDAAVWRPSNGGWYVWNSGSTGSSLVFWGLGSAGDLPVREKQ